MMLYQSFVGEEQRKHLSSIAIPYDVGANTGTDQREFELMKAINSGGNGADREPWGLVSWKFFHKTRITVEDFVAFANGALRSGHDCAFINPMIGNEAIYANVWEQGIDSGHAGMDKIRAFLAANLPDRIVTLLGASHFALCNYFVANPKFWAAYFEYVDDTLRALDAEVAKGSDVGRAYAGAAGYVRDLNATMRPFVVERLFSSFVNRSTHLKCARFEYRREHYESKFGGSLGGALFRLAKLKNDAIDAHDPAMFKRWHDLRSSVLRDSLKVVIWNMDDPSPLLLRLELGDATQWQGRGSPATAPS